MGEFSVRAQTLMMHNMGALWVLLLAQWANGDLLTEIFSTNGASCLDLGVADLLADASVTGCEAKKIYSTNQTREHSPLSS